MALENPLRNHEFSFQNVLEILEVIKATDWADLELESNGSKLKVTRSKMHVQQRPNSDSTIDREAGKSVNLGQEGGDETTGDASPAPVPLQKQDEIDLDGGVAVFPPMAGIFYSAPSPGAPVFVSVGDSVKMGQQLGIVEVMKLFTSVVAPCHGTVRAILFANEASVNNDDIIMIIEPVEE